MYGMVDDEHKQIKSLYNCWYGDIFCGEMEGVSSVSTWNRDFCLWWCLATVTFYFCTFLIIIINFRREKKSEADKRAAVYNVSDNWK